MAASYQPARTESSRAMNTYKIIDIDYELTNRRAFVKGEFKDLQIDDLVVARDSDGNYWKSIVETRAAGGAVVKVLDIFEA